MLLKQKEFCHNCNKEVNFEFYDTVKKQEIICPECGHIHLREIDEGTLINIKLDNRRNSFTAVIMEPMKPYMAMTEEDLIKPIEIKTKEIFVKRVNGKTIAEGYHEELKGERTKFVTDRRYGSTNN